MIDGLQDFEQERIGGNNCCHLELCERRHFVSSTDALCNRCHDKFFFYVPGRTVRSLHKKVAVLLQQLRHHNAGPQQFRRERRPREGGQEEHDDREEVPSIQCIITALDSDETPFKDAREVEIPPLNEAERVGLCRMWLRKFGAEEFESAEFVCSIDAQVECIVNQADSYLPLYIVACAHQAALFADNDMRHRTSDSSGRIQQVSAVCEHLKSLPDTLTSLWSNVVLSGLEAKYGRLTVEWLMLHLLNAPDGISKTDLQGFVRASLAKVYHWQDKSEVPKNILLVGTVEEPKFLIHTDSQKMIWDHRKNSKNEAKPILEALTPIKDVVWCTDGEIEGIMSILCPFLERISPAQANAGPSSRFCLQHKLLRLIAVHRYDHSGSVRNVEQGSRTVVSVNLFGESILDEDVCSILRRKDPGKRQSVLRDSEPVMADSLLPFMESAMRGNDVNSFFRSLDDNSVWHLHR